MVAESRKSPILFLKCQQSSVNPLPVLVRHGVSFSDGVTLKTLQLLSIILLIMNHSLRWIRRQEGHPASKTYLLEIWIQLF